MIGLKKIMLFSIKEKAMNQDSKSKVAFLVYAILVVDNMLLTVVGKFKDIAVNCEFFFFANEVYALYLLSLQYR